MIEELIKKIPRGLEQESGKVFYSGRGAFSGPQGLYILASNPGGDPRDHKEERIIAHTQKVLKNCPQNWSAYRDERWKGAEAGTAQMQSRVLSLLKQLGRDPGAVPASNYIFVRSVREKDIRSRSEALAERCWKFHQAVIDQLGVRIVLCFGKQPADFVKKKTIAETLVKTFTDAAGLENWCYRNNEGLKIIRLTHPSARDWTPPPAALINLVKSALRS